MSCAIRFAGQDDGGEEGTRKNLFIWLNILIQWNRRIISNKRKTTAYNVKREKFFFRFLWLLLLLAALFEIYCTESFPIQNWLFISNSKWCSSVFTRNENGSGIEFDLLWPLMLLNNFESEGGQRHTTQRTTVDVQHFRCCSHRSNWHFSTYWKIVRFNNNSLAILSPNC